jgi:hypothetical protein
MGFPSGSELSDTVPVTWPRFRRRRQDWGSHDACTSAPSSGAPPELQGEQLAQARERWSAWYVAQHNVLTPGTGCPLSCPCCGHPTLSERGAVERCAECGWYDDGQDDHDSEVVRGGPNGCLSLDDARLRYVVRGGSPLPRHPGGGPTP